LVVVAFQGEGIEVRLRLAEGIGIQHFNSGSAYSMMQPGEESAARQPYRPN